MKFVPNTIWIYSFQNDCSSSQPSKAYHHISSKTLIQHSFHLSTTYLYNLTSKWKVYIVCWSALISSHYRWRKKMNKVLYIILISLFSLTVSSCSSGVILSQWDLYAAELIRLILSTVFQVESFSSGFFFLFKKLFPF